MSKMGSHDPFGHLKHKLWSKKGRKSNWQFDFRPRSQESTRFPYVQVVCDIPLESSRWGLECYFRPHLNQRSSHKVIRPQSCERPNFGNFEIPFGSPGTKCHLDVGLVERHRVYYKGEGGGFPQVQAVVSFVSLNLPLVRPSTKNVPTMH